MNKQWSKGKCFNLRWKLWICQIHTQLIVFRLCHLTFLHLIQCYTSSMSSPHLCDKVLTFPYTRGPWTRSLPAWSFAELLLKELGVREEGKKSFWARYYGRHCDAQPEFSFDKGLVCWWCTLAVSFLMECLCCREPCLSRPYPFPQWHSCKFISVGIWISLSNPGQHWRAV